MMNCEQLKREIDLIDESQIEVLSRIIWALTYSDVEAESWGRSNPVNAYHSEPRRPEIKVQLVKIGFDLEVK